MGFDWTVSLPFTYALRAVTAFLSEGHGHLSSRFPSEDCRSEVGVHLLSPSSVVI